MAFVFYSIVGIFTGLIDRCFSLLFVRKCLAGAGFLWFLVAVPVSAQSVAVLDFELHDLTLLPEQATEMERVASLRPLLIEALAARNISTVAISPQAQQAASKGHGYLLDHPELAADLGKQVAADYVVVGRLHKPSFLFAYLMTKLVVVDSGEVLAVSVTEVKGNAAKLTSRAIDALAEKLGAVLPQAARSSVSSAADSLSPSDSDSNRFEAPVFAMVAKSKPFDDVVDDLLLAISGHNFRITEHAKIGSAIAERENISFPLVSVLHFCNLTYAQELILLDPAYSLRMPCRISIRQSEDGNIEIQVLLLPIKADDTPWNQFAEKINGILIDIVEQGAS